MRISDWSSDVCSSDLRRNLRRRHRRVPAGKGTGQRDDHRIPRRARGEIAADQHRRLEEGAGEALEEMAVDLGPDPADPDRIGGGRCERDRHAVGTDEPRPGDEGALLSRSSEEHTSELQYLMRISYAVFCLKRKT